MGSPQILLALHALAKRDSFEDEDARAKHLARVSQMTARMAENDLRVVTQALGEADDDFFIRRHGHVSASQCKTIKACEAQYFYEKVANVLSSEDRRSAATDLGKACHEVWEEYQRDGIVHPAPHTREQLIAYHTLDLLPMPGAARVEGEIWVTTEALPILGFIDYFIPDQGKVEDKLPDVRSLGHLEGVPLVGDHKTSSDVARWAMDDDDLDEDVQCIIYCEWARRETGAKYIDARWTYSGTRKREKKVTQRRFTAEYVQEQFEKLVVPHVKQILVTRFKDRLDTQCNLTACGNYGGCKVGRRGLCHKPEAGSEEEMEAWADQLFGDDDE